MELSRIHKGGSRAYIRSSKAYYAKLLNEPISIMIGIYYPDGGTTGEFEIKFIELLKNHPLSAQLKAFEDSWNVLYLFSDLLEKMSEISGQEIQEPEFCEILDSLGIIDITEYELGVRKNKLK